MRPGAFWSRLVAQPVSSRPEMLSPSTRCQWAPWSELRHRPSPTTLMVTCPFVRFATTPEQPPGQAGLTPLFVKRSSKELETSVHPSAAQAERPDRISIATKNAVNNFRRDDAGSGRFVPSRSCFLTTRVFQISMDALRLAEARSGARVCDPQHGQ